MAQQPMKKAGPGRSRCSADQHEVLAATNIWFSGDFETADPKAGKAPLTNLADVGSWLRVFSNSGY